METLDLGERAMGWNAAITHGLQLSALRREQGRVHEVEELVRRAAAEHPSYPVWRCVLANVLIHIDAKTEARAELDVLTDDTDPLPFDEEWEVSTCLLAEVAVQLGDRARAATLYDRLRPYHDRVAISYPEISLGPIARFLGVLATATARWADGERHFRDSLEMSARIGADHRSRTPGGTTPGCCWNAATRPTSTRLPSPGPRAGVVRGARHGCSFRKRRSATRTRDGPVETLWRILRPHLTTPLRHSSSCSTMPAATSPISRGRSARQAPTTLLAASQGRCLTTGVAHSQRSSGCSSAAPKPTSVQAGRGSSTG